MNLKSRVFWFAGITGVGKTAVATALKYRIQNSLPREDGVKIREFDSFLTSSNRYLSRAERDSQADLVLRQSLLFSEIAYQGGIVIASNIISDHACIDTMDVIFKRVNLRPLLIELMCSKQELLARDHERNLYDIYAGRCANLSGFDREYISLKAKVEGSTHVDYLGINTDGLTVEETVDVVLSHPSVVSA